MVIQQREQRVIRKEINGKGAGEEKEGKGEQEGEEGNVK